MNETVRSVLFFITAMIFSYVHECAHMAAAVCVGKGRGHGKAGYGIYEGRGQARSGFGMKGRGPVMEGRGPFGNVMYLDPDLPPRRKMAVYLAGPASNLLIAAAGVMADRVVGELAAGLEIVILANIMLAAFNLLPFFPLDGGRAAVLLLSAITGPSAALKIGALFSFIFAVCVFISGLYLVQYNDMNIILSADAIYFLYILEREMYGPYGKNRKPSYEGKQTGHLHGRRTLFSR